MKLCRTLLAAAAVILAGCLPRGESNTLDEVLANARSRLSSAQRQEISQDTAQEIEKLVSSIEKLIEDPSSPELAGISKAISQMTLRAGYPSRPALTEIATQYYDLSHLERIEIPQVKLLAARTYFLIATELEGSRFSLKS